MQTLRALVLALALSAADAAAHAQEASAPVDETESVVVAPPQITGFTWVQTPNARQFANAYPTRALERDVHGEAVLSCVIREDGGIDCVIASEEPEGFGLGRSALRVSRYFRAPPTTNDGRATAGGTLTLPIRW